MDRPSGQQSKTEIRHAFRPGDAGRLIELHGLPWTVSSLLAAAQVYHKAGFRLTEEHAQELWGSRLTEQRYDLALRT